MKTVLFLLVLIAAPAVAQELPFSADASEACLSDAATLSQQTACVGSSANTCMESHGGMTTVGMGFCIVQELEYWDSRLNAAYQTLLKREKADDKDLSELGANVPKKAPALRDMQRAWIEFRDAACVYEYSQWGGGTGGGPANAACLMDMTARQALLLEARLAEPK